MEWICQKPDWPDFTYRLEQLAAREVEFQKQSGMLYGAFIHLDQEEQASLKVDVISTEAMKTSEIEGEYLNRESLQSSIKRHFGLESDPRKIPPAERGVSEMMLNLYETYDNPLTHGNLYQWNKALMTGRSDVEAVGKYRIHEEAMQIVSGPYHDPKVHFVAPPSSRMKEEMNGFIQWFNKSAPTRNRPPDGLIRAGIAHLYFVCIHPFEDGNGRIARALSEKALAQSIGQPSLVALAYQIEKNKKAYYSALEQANKDTDITSWLGYFSETILQAQETTQHRIRFLIQKARLFEGVRGQINSRQQKVLDRMFQEGPEGFTGGLSAENYISITKTSRATATRDLADLVSKGVFNKTGELKSTRYWLVLEG